MKRKVGKNIAGQISTLKQGEVVAVPRIPDCNFCEDGTPGEYDFKTRMGPWANGCEEHYKQFRASSTLGVGMAQLWVAQDTVEEQIRDINGTWVPLYSGKV